MNSGCNEGLCVITDILFPKYVTTRDGGNRSVEMGDFESFHGYGRFWNLRLPFPVCSGFLVFPVP